MDLEDPIFRKIIDQSDRFYRIAYSYVKNEQDAMDVVQDVAYKALKHLGKLNNPEYAETWLFRVTINTSLDLLRKQKREQPGLPLIEEGIDDDYGKLAVSEALGLLDEQSRAIIILRYMEDKTFQQIAEILRKNINTVKAINYRALKTLKLELSKEVRNDDRK